MGCGFMKITRIKPLYIPENQKKVKEVYYPVWIYIFSYVVKRRIFGDIKGNIIVLVDGINQKGYLADIFPEIEEINVIDNKAKILEPQISDEKSEEIAKDRAEAFLFRKYAYLKFTYQLTQKAFTYKLFWARKEENKYFLMDSITGEEIEVLPYEEHKKK